MYFNVLIIFLYFMSDILKIEDDLSYSFLFSICYLNQWYFFKAMTKKKETSEGERKEGKKGESNDGKALIYQNTGLGKSSVRLRIGGLYRFRCCVLVFIDKSQQFLFPRRPCLFCLHQWKEVWVFLFVCFWRV